MVWEEILPSYPAHKHIGRSPFLFVLVRKIKSFGECWGKCFWKSGVILNLPGGCKWNELLCLLGQKRESSEQKVPRSYSYHSRWPESLLISLADGRLWNMECLRFYVVQILATSGKHKRGLRWFIVSISKYYIDKYFEIFSQFFFCIVIAQAMSLRKIWPHTL